MFGSAETLRELAKPGNTLILTGRSRLPAHEETWRNDPEAGLLTTEKDLARYFVKGHGLPLGEARSKAKAILAARETLDNIADFRSNGASVEYCAVDVADEAAMADMMAKLYKKYGRIDGIVHGAGVIEDKRPAAKIYLPFLPSPFPRRILFSPTAPSTGR